MTNDTSKYLIVGLGVSGMSVARYLNRTGIAFDVVEANVDRFNQQREQEPALMNARHFSDDLTSEFLCGYGAVVVSPGVSVRGQVFQDALASGTEVVGDVELFARSVRKPVIAVTGSNGKSTVVNMAGELLSAADINAAVVGNVGVACLDSLQDESIDAYVLELSSFQLETTTSLKPKVASVLNISADHLDRYNDLDDYASVKRSIYHNAQHVVFNLDDPKTTPAEPARFKSAVSFSAANPQAAWSIAANASGENVLSGKSVAEIPATSVKVAGVHNQVNALAAMAMVSVLLEGSENQLDTVFTNGFLNFTGLAHRTRFVCESGNVTWINDSKGTNVGATVSAIRGMSAPVVLIAGGRGKNADFTPLREVIGEFCTAVVLIGEDAVLIEQVLGNIVPVYREGSMQEAVKRAAEISRPGDCVLLSPACASFDMFDSFEERGDVFETEVRKQCA